MLQGMLWRVHGRRTFDDMPHDTPQAIDVVVIGGGAAGLAAALQLARSRRSVVVVDAGEPRNAPAAHMHGYLGHDGLSPAELLALGREEVRSYGATIVDGAATTLAGGDDGFEVGLADGTTLLARRVVVATGLVDELPDIPGVAEQWGRGVLHCPYCHGWEVRDQAIVVVATGPFATHQALLFRQLSDRVTVVVHQGPGPDPEDRARLSAVGVEVVEGPVGRIAVQGDAVRGVELVDGRSVAADAVVVAPRFVARSELLAGVGVEPVSAPMGSGLVIETDDRGATSAAGVYAAGNVSDVSNQVLHAAAEGSRVGAMVNADLVQDDVARAAAAVQGDDAAGWDARYVSRGQRMWSGMANGALVAEVEHLPAGRALDVGCGEGADAIWLAERGWDVVGVDISDVAISRARTAAAERGVDVDLRAVDLTVQPPEQGAYDLVSMQYPALRKDAGPSVVASILGAVAPGGTLLAVWHDLSGGHHGAHHDPAHYVLADDLIEVLDDAWTLELHEVRPRSMHGGRQGAPVPDVVVRARRNG